MIDLHLHSTYSDGSHTPAELVGLARAANMAAISLTDHDNVGGLDEATAEARIKNIKFIPGIELSSKFRGRNIHLLGYFIDWHNKDLTSKLKELREARVVRIHELIDRLNNNNVNIKFEDIDGVSDRSSIGRVHVAKALYKKQLVRSVSEAFKKYLVPGTKTYVDKKVLPAEESIEVIKKAGGLAFIAHPGIEKLNNHIDQLVDLGIDGIEVYHPNHRMDDIIFFEDYVNKKQLLCSGGSDFHGTNSSLKKVVGGIFVPDACASKMAEKQNRPW